MTRAAIGLGSNLGNREKLLHEATQRLQALGESVAVSSIYLTEPIGPEQPDYLNMVVVIDTGMDPEALLAGLLEIERTMGRRRDERWGPRLIDLDLLLYGDQSVRRPGLTVPHPDMLERRFVLEPLVEVWPDARLPDGREVADYLDAVQHQRVERVTRSAPTGWRGSGLSFTAKGGWWVVAQGMLFSLIIMAAFAGDEVPTRFGAWSVVLGGVLLVAAGVLALGAAWVLGGATTPYPAPLPGARFVDRGVYRLVRHPMYSGAVLGFCGLSLVRSSLPGLILGVALIPFFWSMSSFEEGLLGAHYPSYGAYRNRVRRRFIPWVV